MATVLNGDFQIDRLVELRVHLINTKRLDKNLYLVGNIIDFYWLCFGSVTTFEEHCTEPYTAKNPTKSSAMAFYVFCTTIFKLLKDLHNIACSQLKGEKLQEFMVLWNSFQSFQDKIFLIRNKLIAHREKRDYVEIASELFSWGYIVHTGKWQGKKTNPPLELRPLEDLKILHQFLQKFAPFLSFLSSPSRE